MVTLVTHDLHAWFGGRPAGVSSRLHRAGEPITPWVCDSGVTVELPVALDLVEVDSATGQTRWWVVAHIGLVADSPVVTHLALGAQEGLDLMRLQREFRWQTPIDVISRIVPRLISLGLDPFTYEFPVDGFPEASLPVRTQGRQLSDEFLEDIAREYLQHGRGYVKELASAHQVSERTITSWVHKARQRGIITDTRRGAKGGQWVDRDNRKGAS